MSTQEIKLQSEALLKMDWTQEEKELISRLLKHMIDYKYMIPSYLKQDILSILKMANNLRNDYELLLKKSDFFGNM